MNEYMPKKPRKPIFTLRPNLVNALTPYFLKNLFISAVISALVYLFFSVLTYVSKEQVYEGALFSTIVIVFLVFLLIPFLISLILLKCTKYEFYTTNVVKQFKLIAIKKHAILYNQILEVKIEVSIWGRMTKAGNIQLVSADDSSENLTLQYVEDPETVEKKIYSLIHKVNKSTKRTSKK